MQESRWRHNWGTVGIRRSGCPAFMKLAGWWCHQSMPTPEPMGPGHLMLGKYPFRGSSWCEQVGPEGVDDVPVGWIIEASLGPLVGEVRAKKKDESANYQRFWPVATAGWIGDGSDLLAHIEGAEKYPSDKFCVENTWRWWVSSVRKTQ